jgi:SAM-dependent methyltransferase
VPALLDRPLLAPTGEAAPAWPDPVRDELAQRRRRILAAAAEAGGSVLDLGDHTALVHALETGLGPARPAGQAGGPRFDVAVSIAALVAVADLPAVLRGIDRLVDPDGRFLFVEPVSGPGLTGLLAASAGARLRPVRHQHLGRDVPLAIRQAGFIITDLERFTMSTSVWPLRSFVDGVGRPRSGFASGGSSGSGGSAR